MADYLRAAFSKRDACELILLGDAEIALDVAFKGAPGVLVMAGTGSNVAGRYVARRLTTAGGWGPALADQGSGHRIGHRALWDMFLAIDEGRETPLLPAVKEFWQLDSLAEVIAFANQIPSPDFSRLTHLVLCRAEDGDAIRKLHFRDREKILAIVYVSSFAVYAPFRATLHGCRSLPSPDRSWRRSIGCVDRSSPRSAWSLLPS